MLYRIYVGPQLGGHTHLRVFCGRGRGYTLGKCGDLTFRNEEVEGFLGILADGAKSPFAVKGGFDVEIIHEQPKREAPVPPVG